MQSFKDLNQITSHPAQNSSVALNKIPLPYPALQSPNDLISSRKSPTPHAHHTPPSLGSNSPYSFPPQDLCACSFPYLKSLSPHLPMIGTILSFRLQPNPQRCLSCSLSKEDPSHSHEVLFYHRSYYDFIFSC